MKFETKTVVIPLENIDTDQIIPARFLKTLSKVGLGEKLFQDWRYETDGTPKADFILISHSHFNHCMDMPYIAKKTGATVIGTE